MADFRAVVVLGLLASSVLAWGLIRSAANGDRDLACWPSHPSLAGMPGDAESDAE